MRGFKGFLGGLDSDRDLTGELSVYTKFQELEIMFHVSTLLPFSPKDSQQVGYSQKLPLVGHVHVKGSLSPLGLGWPFCGRR